MRKLILFTIAVFVCTVLARAQGASVHGSVSDTINKKQLYRTTISPLRKTDSVLVKFTRSEKNGVFKLKNLLNRFFAFSLKKIETKL